MGLKAIKGGRGKLWQRTGGTIERYCAEDTAVTARAFHAILAEAEWNTPRVQELYRIHTRLSQIAERMYRRGIMVDEGERQRLDQALMAQHLEKKAELLRLISSENFKGTPDDMRALIYKRHARSGLKSFELDDPLSPDMYTDDTMTKCAVDQPALLNLYVNPGTPEELQNIIKAYWHANAPRKARSTYVTGETVLKAIGADGRLRPSWNSCGTETMRWACSEPNVMNIPEAKGDDSLGGTLPNIRSMYCAGHGRVIVHADFSQQELRIMRAVAKDDELGRALDSGDVYSYDAKLWFGGQIPAEYDLERVKEQFKGIRKACKIIHLASQYAAGPSAIYTQALKQDRGMTFGAVKTLNAQWMKSYWRTATYWQEELERVTKCGYSEGRLLGGRRYYPAQPPITETANYPVQRTAGEMTALAMLKADDLRQKLKLRGDFISILHDAFDIECPASEQYVWCSVLEEAMVGPYDIDGKSTDMPVDTKVGFNMGQV